MRRVAGFAGLDFTGIRILHGLGSWGFAFHRVFPQRLGFARMRVLTRIGISTWIRLFRWMSHRLEVTEICIYRVLHCTRICFFHRVWMFTGFGFHMWFGFRISHGFCFLDIRVSHGFGFLVSWIHKDLDSQGFGFSHSSDSVFCMDASFHRFWIFTEIQIS